MNEERLKDGEEVVIIPCQPERIAEVIENYIADPGRLALLAQNGQRSVQRLFSIDAQMAPRLQMLSDLLIASRSAGEPQTK